MNLITIMGRLVADVEASSTASGMSVANYRVAVDRRFAKEGQQKTDFFPCVSFSKQAEFAEKYLKKGTKVVISGEMHMDLVQKNGTNTTYPKIIVNEVEFAESKRDTQETAETKNDFLSIPDELIEELPFS